ncbi:hypothetical protein ACOMHN_031799 [Nucella lapillus]
MDTETFTFASSTLTSDPCPLSDDTVILSLSGSTLYNNDDVSVSVSHDDASSDCDVRFTNHIPDEKANTNDEESVSADGTSNATHPQIPDQIPDQFPQQITEQMPDQFPQQITEQIPDQYPQQTSAQIPDQIPQQTSEQIPEQTSEQIPKQIPDPNEVPHLPDIHKVNSDAIVRVQHRETRQWGSEVKATILPVADLAKDLPTLTQAKLEPVPVSHHFYNQWARVPRPDDSDGDVTNTSRKPISMRMFTVTGSLKSYTLMNAIVRDKRSPIQNFADLFQTSYASQPSSFLASPQEGTSEGKPSKFPRSLSDTVLTRNGFTKTTELSSQCPESQIFPPIGDSRAQTAPNVSKGVGFSREFVSAPTEGIDCSSASQPSFGCERLLGVDVKRRPVNYMMPRRLHCSSSFCGNPSSSSPALRPLQALSINTASLLYTSAIDMRNQYYDQLIHRHPRGLFIKATQHPDTKEGTKSKTVRLCDGRENGEIRGREVTRVEFIDFSEVRSGIQSGKEGERRISMKKGGEAGVRSGRASRRAACDADPRHGRVNAGHFLAVGMTLPLHATTD